MDALWHTIAMALGTTISLRHKTGQDLSRALRPVLVDVHEFAGRAALDAAMTRRLAIVAEELLINLLEHAIPTADSGEIACSLKLEWREDTLFLALEDDSVRFDPRRVTLLELPNADRGGGVGLALVKAFATIDDYVSADGINCLTLRMNPRPDSD